VLNDPRYNEVEVVIEKLNGSVCFTHGWSELNSLYESVEPTRIEDDVAQGSSNKPTKLKSVKVEKI
jgi:hypothetical protein